MTLIRDHSGKKYNHLTFLAYSRPGGSGVGSVWKVRCDCGTVRDAVAREVIRGGVKTCGKCEYNRRLISNKVAGRPSPKRAERMLYGSYSLRAYKKGVDWQLTEDDFIRIIHSNCLICREMPGTRYQNTKLRYNHLVRIENNRPYTLENCVALCRECAMRKGKSNLQELLDYIIRAHTMLEPNK